MIPSWGQLLYGILRISEGGLTPLNFDIGARPHKEMGLLGEYLSKTYLEVKKRPIYLSKESSVERRGRRQRGRDVSEKTILVRMENDRHLVWKAGWRS